MNKFWTAFFISMSALTTHSIAAPVDLSSWLTEGAGTWNLQSGNNAVKQTINGDPTVFYNGVDSQGLSLAGTIEVQTTSDDDFIGFVLGYQSGGVSGGSGATDFLLVDWKQGDQTFHGGFAPGGLAISHVTSPLAHDSGAWWHDPSKGVTELQRATNLGSTGWADNTSYSFELLFTAALVEVFVNGVKELSVESSLIGKNFANGSFGFYNYSQQSVLYAGITEDLATVPVPAGLPLLLGGLGALFAFGRKSKSA